MFGNFFKRRKYRVIAFGEVKVNWVGGNSTVFCIIFFENDNGKRKWTSSGGGRSEYFSNTSYQAACEIWKHTGLFPEWAKDPVAEKLSR
ncbi:hypothetical protein LCGC14_1449340 [marine sediment metagenome]|uniref:Uncharacterized protein n=1 Tax=marine sediment metagenome TaxID=412755 RepID=A0A0F9JI86_9ZZZZ